MREIKFRLFYKPENKMKNLYEILPQNKIVTWYEDGEQDWCYYSTDGSNGDAVIMQYTGLKDINGTEIYEGDILLWDEAEWGCINREVVAWDYDQFYTRRNDWPQWCEVVGNVYENPELTRNRER